jgi:hypothetical protein
VYSIAAVNSDFSLTRSQLVDSLKKSEHLHQYTPEALDPQDSPDILDPVKAQNLKTKALKEAKIL